MLRAARMAWNAGTGSFWPALWNCLKLRLSNPVLQVSFDSSMDLQFSAKLFAALLAEPVAGVPLQNAVKTSNQLSFSLGESKYVIRLAGKHLFVKAEERRARLFSKEWNAIQNTHFALVQRLRSLQCTNVLSNVTVRLPDEYVRAKFRIGSAGVSVTKNKFRIVLLDDRDLRHIVLAAASAAHRA